MLVTLILGHFSFNLRAVPERVPPVPAPATNMSIFPEIESEAEVD